MTIKPAALTQPRPAPTLNGLREEALRLWQISAVRAALQVIFLIGVGGLAACAKSVSLPLGIPGSSGMLWLTPLVAGYIFVNKRGSGLLMGTSLALWGMPLGIHHELVFNICLYGITGLSLDVLAAIPLINLRNPFWAILCGVLAHMVKYGFNTEAVMLSGVMKNFVIIGLGKSAVLHALFGGIAGLTAWITWNAANGKEKKTRTPGILRRKAA